MNFNLFNEKSVFFRNLFNIVLLMENIISDEMLRYLWILFLLQLCVNPVVAKGSVHELYIFHFYIYAVLLN